MPLIYNFDKILFIFIYTIKFYLFLPSSSLILLFGHFWISNFFIFFCLILVWENYLFNHYINKVSRFNHSRSLIHQITTLVALKIIAPGEFSNSGMVTWDGNGAGLGRVPPYPPRPRFEKHVTGPSPGPRRVWGSNHPAPVNTRSNPLPVLYPVTRPGNYPNLRFFCYDIYKNSINRHRFYKQIKYTYIHIYPR